MIFVVAARRILAKRHAVWSSLYGWEWLRVCATGCCTHTVSLKFELFFLPNTNNENPNSIIDVVSPRQLAVVRRRTFQLEVKHHFFVGATVCYATTTPRERFAVLNAPTKVD